MLAYYTCTYMHVHIHVSVLSIQIAISPIKSLKSKCYSFVSPIQYIISAVYSESYYCSYK